LTTQSDLSIPGLRQFVPRASLALVLALLLTAVTDPASGAEPAAVTLPPGVEALWDIDKAQHEKTPSRERICLNGLWQWQPAAAQDKTVPDAKWGYFKVPGCWPGITDYMQKDCQMVYSHPEWRGRQLAALNAAWYQREIAIPKSWNGRRVFISMDYLNSYAALYIDGRELGECRFPGGQIEITGMAREAGVHRLSVLVVALPLKGVMLSYTDSASAREQKGSVARRGLCGDVYLSSLPAGPRMNDVRIETSVRKQELTIHAGLEDLAAGGEYQMRARVLEGGKVVKEFKGHRFKAGELHEDRFALTERWLPEKLWDVHTPNNQYDLDLSLIDGAGHPLDTSWTVRFGFREFWIDGRDFYLNGTRIFLSAVPLDNAQVSAALATYERARETLERLRSFGINFVYTHNYGCEPGAHLGFEEILRAADDAGMLVSFSQPHFSHYDWKAADADRNNGYARHAEFYVRAAQNHPAVVMYSMSHNATGYDEDMNPDLIDGIHDARDSWALRNVAMANRAEAIVRQLDPSRIVYHHASGNLGSMHAINFYPNFVPIQELSDWFGHWSAQGVKPVFLCEYGAPFTWDWTMYRGWYKGEREFGSAAVPWEFCLAEWNAQFLGDRAYAISDAEKRNLRWEAQQFRAGKLWHRWDYPVQVGSSVLEERYPVFAMYLTDNWRAFRTWGVSAVSPWEYEHFWRLRPGVDRSRQVFKVDWRDLQRPGFSPDYEDQRYERMDLAYKTSDWEATPAALALLANNASTLAYIAGKPAAFSSKDHLFLPGETVSKQLVVINNSRQRLAVNCEWSFEGPGAVRGTNHLTIDTGQQLRIPINVNIPDRALPGAYQLHSVARFNNGAVQSDSFTVDILSPATNSVPQHSVALFDPPGETRALMEQLKVPFEAVRPETALAGYDLLVIGKGALTVDGPAPDVSRVRDGLKVLVFEQTSEVLEKRFGFRVEEYGLRQVFPRVASHPALSGLGTSELRDWRGEASLLPPRLKYENRPRYGPTVEWCGIPVPHLWRCGNRGNVASVLIEKPVRGDFLPILDGGFSLQFSPLLEYREGKGLVLFCQMDVTARSDSEPAADLLARNLLGYLAKWHPIQRRDVVYIGDPAGKKHLESVGIVPSSYDGANLPAGGLLVLGPGGAQSMSSETAAVSSWLRSGGEILAIGGTGEELSPLLPLPIQTERAEHISCFFEAFPISSVFAGVGPADTHNRDPREFPLVTTGAQRFGDGVLAQTGDGKVVFCQLVPWLFGDKQPNLKKTYRRTAFLLSRVLANLGAVSTTPLLERFHVPEKSGNKGRWLTGFYLDQPEEWDDPYRHFRW
jgi:beta-galactosidase